MATNNLVRQEGFFLGLEAAPLLIVGLILTIMHPGSVFPGAFGDFYPGSIIHWRSNRRDRRRQRRTMEDQARQRKTQQRLRLKTMKHRHRPAALYGIV